MNLLSIQLVIIIISSILINETNTTALPSQINIGAIFKRNDRKLINSLYNIVDRINNDKKILPRTNITIISKFILKKDLLQASKITCQMLKKKVWLILTIDSDSANRFVRSTSDLLHIPHISIQWDYRSAYIDNVNFPNKKFNNNQFNDQTSFLIRGNNGGYYTNINVNGNAETGFRFTSSNPQQNFYRISPLQQQQRLKNIKHLTLNIYPDATELSEALKDFVDSRSWKSFTLIYDSNDALIRCKDLLSLANRSKPGRPKLKVSVMNFKEFDNMAKLQGKLNVDKRQIKRKNKNKKNKNNNDNNNPSSYYYHRNRYRPYNNDTIILNNNFNNQHLNQQQQWKHYVYMKLWKEIKSSEHNFILSLTNEHIIDLLREAKKLHRMSEYDNYFIITMDLHLLNLTEFQSLEPLPNITTLSLINRKNNFFIHNNDDVMINNNYDNYLNNPIQNNFSYLLGNINNYNNPNQQNQNQKSLSTTTNLINTYEALIYDSMTLFARSLDDLDRSNSELIIEPFVQCNLNVDNDQNDDDNLSSTLMLMNQKPWPLGYLIIDYMKNLGINGISGPLQFNNEGLRVNFTLDVLQLKSDGLKTIAKWTRKNGIKSIANYTFYDSYREILEAMKFKELLITVPPSSIPYVSLLEDHENYSGNNKFYGFCVDLLEEIAKVFRQDFQSDFKYVIQISQDGQYGRPDKETGEWNGMFGELIRHQADLAIADLTATYLRETAVDFTMPFMNLGIAILFKKPSAPEPEMFSFLKPFSAEVWLYLASAFLGISLLLWIMSRISPYEWESPHSCDPESIELCNQFSIGNSLWFTIGSLMQQGSDLGPRALSTRCLATIWWFFTLIIISSYTANLAASLTLSRMAPAISSVEDLAKQTSILYGCRKGGSTWEFFAQSNNTIYQRMFNTMEANPEVYINKVTDAIERVRKGGYAYLAESSTIEYLIQRRCDLIQVGNWLDNKGYGIATPPDSPYRTPISNAITVLQDRGTLYQLKKRWWVEKGGGLCTDDTVFTSAAELEIENLGGVFLVLTVGVLIGLLCGFIEFIWKSLKISRDERESIFKLIWLEIFRICSGGGSSRPVFQQPSTMNMTQLFYNNNNNNNDNGDENDSLFNRNQNENQNNAIINTPSFTSATTFDNNNYYLPSPNEIIDFSPPPTATTSLILPPTSPFSSLPMSAPPPPPPTLIRRAMPTSLISNNNNPQHQQQSMMMKPLISMNSTKSLNNN